ncbi:MAG: tRNA (adenosine(37)-N6)-threonylcarbamoyltransferase complex ATPase subunit type 1 TsaE [Boseongicola sp. SB0676_bin_33]|nr:tRNA (adenosine(37)-N6)-threonylcarbamoyltransferase complex ATPase subunit type 1 TsaE [Boseongicola sp. SB0676_bin_33]MYK32739.1 tRNA (adenosine(37)-N6)-threonylcarbamoyltransferase complex ATPase subunit type 1 TsaE [Boseongicola sp. SB0670_bin_30]
MQEAQKGRRWGKTGRSGHDVAFSRVRSSGRAEPSSASAGPAGRTDSVPGSQGSVFLPDAAATDRFGTALAHALNPGDTVLLAGQIGAGKTCIARAAISALHFRMGQPEPEVPSPTFTLVQAYELPGIQVWHADLYRLAEASEVAELGLQEAFGNEIVLVEWPDRLDVMPDDALLLDIEVLDRGRRVTLRSASDRWQNCVSMIGDIDA